MFDLNTYMGGASHSGAFAGPNPVATNKCWALQENPLSWRSLHKLHLKTVFPCWAERGNVHHGHALFGAWGGLRGSGVMALGAVGSLQSCKV